MPNDDPQQLFPLFRAANSSHSGSLTEMELGSALVNGDYTSFHPKTVKMMIRMFDRNSSGTISFDEFVSLWRYLAAWRELFDRFDVDRSGRISLREFEDALVAFGYRLSQPFVSVLFTTFESKGRQMNGPGKGPGPAGMSFDLFVQACISLRRMTDVFKRYDDDRDGYITVSFEEFLTGEWTPPGYFQFEVACRFQTNAAQKFYSCRIRVVEGMLVHWRWCLFLLLGDFAL
jgi:Ca2+-binding EF-hand superfamily protein